MRPLRPWSLGVTLWPRAQVSAGACPLAVGPPAGLPRWRQGLWEAGLRPFWGTC